MTTLASTVVATLLVMLLGVVVGRRDGRSPLADRLIRPVLDAAQVMPPFVYLVPFPRAVRRDPLHRDRRGRRLRGPRHDEDHRRRDPGGPGDHRRGGHRRRSSTWQIITKVQLPMAAAP